jgi:branched-chain amino acid transport system ATP-binding protein
MDTILSIDNISMAFGGLIALDRVSFNVNKGEILGLIGPNGAGKTTLFNVISGVYSATKGSVIYKGENLNGLKPHEVAARGIARIFQHVSLFKKERVIDNVLLGSYLKRKSGIFDWFLNNQNAKAEEKQLLGKAEGALARMNLSKDHEYELVENLPYGKQRALAISIALGMDPELLLLDEPVTGMNQTETIEMTKLLRELRSDKLTLILIEHNMLALMNLATRIIVLNQGQKIADGTPEAIRANKEVIDAYLGRQNSEQYTP